MISIKLEKSLGFDANGKESFEEKLYCAPDPKARMVRKAAEMTECLDETKLKTADLDLMIEYVVELFGKRFTADDVWDGLSASKLMPTIIGCINDVMQGMGTKLGTIPNAPAE